GPAARRRPTAAREAYFLYVERAAEGANAADGPLSSLWPRPDLPSQLDGDVAVGVERHARAGRHHARRIVLLDDARADPGRGQRRAIQDRRLAPAEAGAEVHTPRGPVAPAGAVSADPLRHAGAIGDAMGDHPEVHDLDGLIIPAAVPVRPLVIPAERPCQRGQPAGVDRPVRHRDGQSEGLAMVAAIRR